MNSKMVNNKRLYNNKRRYKKLKKLLMINYIKSVFVDFY